MSTISADSLFDSLLPLSKMAAMQAALSDSYKNAIPYPHIVVDDFLDPAVLDLVLSEFPKPGAIKWIKFDNEKEIKLASSVEQSFGPATRLLMYHLNSASFLDFLSGVTGIPNLIPDPYFEGGGLHQITRGGKLGIHADFNKHVHYGVDRRLNAIIYLNKDWREEYGGHLELWNKEVTKCEAKILPLFNRLVVFGTTDFTYHGHPDPLQCPEDMTRKSLALYCYSNGRPAEEISGEHSTLFMARSADDFKLDANQKIRRLVKDMLPPIILRQFKKKIKERPI
jgi:2OG-Fe(II) oxygenase superfamily